MNAQLMEDFNARSNREQADYLRESREIERIIKSVQAENNKRMSERMNPDKNYKLIYR